MGPKIKASGVIGQFRRRGLEAHFGLSNGAVMGGIFVQKLGGILETAEAVEARYYTAIKRKEPISPPCSYLIW